MPVSYVPGLSSHAWCWPLPRAMVQGAGASPGTHLAPEAVLLLSRCAQVLTDGPAATSGSVSVDPQEVRDFWELAANENDRTAQLAMGLWLARMQVDGKR